MSKGMSVNDLTTPPWTPPSDCVVTITLLLSVQWSPGPSDVTTQIFVQIELLASHEYCEHWESASNEFGENNRLGLKNLFLLSERFEKIF